MIHRALSRTPPSKKKLKIWLARVVITLSVLSCLYFINRYWHRDLLHDHIVHLPSEKITMYQVLNIINETSSEKSIHPCHESLEKIRTQKRTMLKESIEKNDVIFHNDVVHERFMPFIGNGYLGRVMTTGASIQVAGLYADSEEKHKLGIKSQVQDIVLLGNVVDSAELSYEIAAFSLDMKKATFERYGALIDHQSCEVVSITDRWYAHRVHQNTLIHEIEIENMLSSDARIQLKSKGKGTSDPVVRDFSVTYKKRSESGESQVSVHIIVLETLVSRDPFILASGAKQSYRFITLIMTDLESKNLIESSQKKYNEIIGYDPLLSHINSWTKLWDASVEIEGDPNLQATVSSSLYYLYSSIRSDWISGGDIVSNIHVTYEAESHIFPALLLLHPSMARSIIQYRFDRIESASYHAKENQFEGYMFPRESAYTGNEVGAKITSPMDVHVSGQVAMAVRQYWLASGDIDWILEVGFPIVSNVAKFLNSRSNLRPDSHYHHFEKVIGPDPTHYNVDDEVYTNALSAIVLHTAHTFVDQFAYCYPHYKEYIATHWEDIADNIHMPYMANEYHHDQYVGYLGDSIQYPSVISVHYPLHFLKRKRLVNTHIYKNLRSDSIRKIMVNDLKYYEKRVDRERSSVGSVCMISIAWIETARMYYNAGSTREARELVYQAKRVFDSIRPNVVGPFHVWFDNKSYRTSHYISGIGTFLQNLVYGFGGLKLVEDYDNIILNGKRIDSALMIQTMIIGSHLVLPTKTESMKFNNVHYHGYRFDIEMHKSKGIKVTCTHHISDPIVRLIRKFRYNSSETKLDCHERSITIIPNDSQLESILLVPIRELPLNYTCTRGLFPDQQPHYYRQSLLKIFKCANDTKTIPFESVNDGYCDCLDGSDEPGTDACMKGRFYCPFHQNPKGISSGFVNDGICDCCDGSDEWKTEVKCTKRCIDEKREIELQKRREREEKALETSRTSYFVVILLVMLHLIVCSGVIACLLCNSQSEKKKII